MSAAGSEAGRIHGLGGFRVVDFSTGYTGPYATKLLADGGADVVKVEPPEGDPLRRWSVTGADLGGDDSAIFRFLNTSKRSVVGRPGDPHVDELLAGADLVVEDLGPGGFDVAGVQARWPHLVVLSISPFGAGGPISDKPSTEFVVQAESGSLLYRGRPDQPPIQAGGRITHWTAGSYAAPAAAAAMFQARRTGRGAHVDLSELEVMAIAASTFSDLAHHLGGRPELTTKCRNLETPSIHPAKDGWIGFNTNAAHMFQGLLIMMERPDLLDDAELATFAGRSARIDEWEGMLNDWTRQHTCADIMALAADLRVPCVQVYDGESVFTNEHLAARGVWVDNPAGFRQPRPPYLVDGRAPRPFAPAPRLGEHTGRIEPRVRPAGTTAAGTSAAGTTAAGTTAAGTTVPGEPAPLPFAGLKVVDLTSWWAGPSSTHLLALLGAEVVHIESTGHPDGMRLTGYMFGRPDWWEWGHMFAAANTNKLDVTLDVNAPAGKELLRKLIEWGDVLVENFVPRVVEQWGFGRDEVHARNPGIVYMRMPAFGLTGPWRERPGFAQTMEQMTGMAWITGHEYDQPRIMRGPCDPIAGMHGAFAVMVALAEREHRRAQGEPGGVFVESTMIEASLNCAAEQIVEFSAYGRTMGRAGNKSAHAAPQGVYACPGFEQWLAVSVETDEQWHALRGVLGDPAWAADPELATLAGRRRHHALLDEHLEAWAASRDLDAAVAELVAAGVPAARCFDPRVLSRHQQVVARHFYEEVDHPSLGRHPVPGLPYRWTGVERWVQRATPTLGQDNRDVYARILGLTGDEIDGLERDGVIGTRPKGQ